MKVPLELAARLTDAFAGFCGGVVYAARFPLSSATKTVLVVLIGTLSASFLAEDVAALTHLSRGASGFLVGFGAYQLAAYVLDAAISKIRKPKDGANG